MLINASKDGAAAATTTAGTSGTTAETAPATAAAGKSYTLIGGDPSDLQKWANSKVEIKGTGGQQRQPESPLHDDDRMHRGREPVAGRGSRLCT